MNKPTQPASANPRRARRANRAQQAPRAQRERRAERGDRAGRPPAAGLHPVPLGLLRPIRIDLCPEFEVVLADYAGAIEAGPRPGESEWEWNRRKGRFNTSRTAIDIARACGGRVVPSHFHYEPSGRIRLDNPSLQQMPRCFRRYIFASPGHLFVDSDLSSAHAAIAAFRSGDVALRDAVLAGRLYDDLARDWGLPKQNVKIIVLGMLNGMMPGGVGKELAAAGADPERGERVWGAFFVRFSALFGFMQGLRSSYDSGKPCVPLLASNPWRVSTLTRTTGDIEPKSWRSLAFAMWASVEADILADTMQRLIPVFGHLGGGLCLPMYDGLLCEFPCDNAEEGRRAVEWAMREALAAAGVVANVKTCDPRATWGER